jgi:hypothetical protein
MAAVDGPSKGDAFAAHPKLIHVPAGEIGGLLDFRVLTRARTAYVRNLTNGVRGRGAGSRHSRWYT